MYCKKRFIQTLATKSFLHLQKKYNYQLTKEDYDGKQYLLCLYVVILS